MSNKKIKIIHWDDDEMASGFTAGMIPHTLKDFECEVEAGQNFITSRVEFSKLIRNTVYDLVILDIENKADGTDLGFELLNDVITVYGNLVPILIFSRHPRVLDKIGDFKTQHAMKIEFLNKGQMGEPYFHQKAKEKLKILLNLGLSNVEITTTNDYKTKAAVKSIGLQNLQNIIAHYQNAKSILSKEKVNLRAIAPGYSGAFVLEITFGTTTKLIKVSHDKSAIMREYENLNSYSTYLPSAIKVDYDRIEPSQLSSEGWYAIVYEFVPYSKTLFGFIASNQTQYTAIEKLLATIFSDERFLKLYSHTQDNTLPINENILEDIDEVRASFIENAIKILEPILQSHSSIFDKNIISSITGHRSYNSITKASIGKPNSSQILSHADLHADNILVDSENLPIVIDPGSVSYKYWAYDINRLLIDFFIRGIGHQTLDYFDINSIEKDYILFQNFISRSHIEIKTSKANEGFITAINWLLKNITSIHKDRFVEWEFQLGLGLELLKASYKSISLPANKRALALLCACEAIRKANSTFEAGKT